MQIQKSILFLLLLTSSLRAQNIYQSLSCEKQWKSGGNGQAVSISFMNQSPGKVKIYWLDFEGKAVLYSELDPQSAYNQNTYGQHIWKIENNSGKCLGIYQLTGIKGEIVIGAKPSVPILVQENTQPKKITESDPKVRAITAELKNAYNLSPFYKKYINESGVPVLSSDKVPDEALVKVNQTLMLMLKNCPKVVEKLKFYKIRLAVMAVSEKTLDIPEHSDLQQVFPETDWNTRARGLGATLVRPTTSCAEENVLCYANDPYRGENILGLMYADPTLYNEVKAAYNSAMQKGLWKNTYAATNFDEYWAEGVQSWFNVNMESIPSNGIHNEINTREELKNYDPVLAQLIQQVFGEYEQDFSCR